MDWEAILEGSGISKAAINKFARYHEQNPDIWLYYELEALKRIRNGASYLGSQAIFAVIRCNPEIIKNEKFKINNNYSPIYARYFVYKHPQHRDKFLFKVCKSV